MNKLRGSSKTNVMKKINQKASDGANDGELKLVSSSANLNKSERRKRLVNTKAKVSYSRFLKNVLASSGNTWIHREGHEHVLFAWRFVWNVSIEEGSAVMMGLLIPSW